MQTKANVNGQLQNHNTKRQQTHCHAQSASSSLSPTVSSLIYVHACVSATGALFFFFLFFLFVCFFSSSCCQSSSHNVFLFHQELITTPPPPPGSVHVDAARCFCFCFLFSFSSVLQHHSFTTPKKNETTPTRQDKIKSINQTQQKQHLVIGHTCGSIRRRFGRVVCGWFCRVWRCQAQVGLLGWDR